MSQGRSSLLSDNAFETIGSKGSKGGSKGKPDTVALAKLIGGGVILVLGIGLILNALGVFSGPPAPPKMSEAEIIQHEEKVEQQKRELLEINKGATIGGA